MTEVIQLTYEEHKKYYDLYINNNDLLKKIIDNNISQYTFDYDPKKYYQLDEFNIITRNIYENTSMIIQLNSIIERNIYGYCIETEKKYLCEKMSTFDAHFTFFFQYSYHFNCNDDNEFIIFFRWEYFTPFMIYYPKKNISYNISYRLPNSAYNQQIFGNGFLELMNSGKIYDNTKHNFISYTIGLMSNPGHFFWNELIGLMIIIENNLLDNIDEFIIYNYDYVNIGNILKNKYNKTVKYIQNNESHGIVCNVIKHFINNSLVETFKKVYDLNIKSNITNVINILFDLRSYSRIWLNQVELITNIINELKKKYKEYNFNFYIAGFYKYEIFNKTETCYGNNEVVIVEENKVFNEIQAKFDFEIINLINQNLSDIIQILPNIDLVVANAGSGCSLIYATILNKDMIAFTNLNSYYSFDNQKYAFHDNINNTSYLDPSAITNNGSNFYIDTNILLNTIFLRIDKIINNRNNKNIINYENKEN